MPSEGFRTFRESHKKNLKSRADTENLIQLQHGKKCFLRHFYISNLPHALLTFFLFLEQFSFTADVTTITFCSNIFTHRADVFACNNFCTDRCLYCDLELLARQQL